MKPEEKVPYLKTLLYIALADDHIDESELHYFQQLGQVYSLDEVQIQEIQDSVVCRKESIESIASKIIERDTKLTLLYDLLAICYADNQYTLAEKEGLKDVCSLLKIEDSKLNELETVMEESVKLQERINMILER